MTQEVKNILEKYDILQDNLYEDNLDFLSEEEKAKLTDILIIYEEFTRDTQIKLLMCANELNALNNDTLYLTYTLNTDDYEFLYLTTLHVVNET